MLIWLTSGFVSALYFRVTIRLIWRERRHLLRLEEVLLGYKQKNNIEKSIEAEGEIGHIKDLIELELRELRRVFIPDVPSTLLFWLLILAGPISFIPMNIHGNVSALKQWMRKEG